MDAAKPKPNKGNAPSAASTRFRDAGSTALVLSVIVLGAYNLDLQREPRPRDATTTLTSTHGASEPPVDDGIVPGAIVVRPANTDDSESGCYAALRDASVPYERVPSADGVTWPILLTGPIDGVRIHGTGKQDAPTNYLDCRLARALLAWAPFLRDKGVVGLEHYSMYRADSVVGHSNKPSGHAIGRAIDVGKFELSDGRTLNVLTDWKHRARGKDPCQPWLDDKDGRVMRQLVCEAASRGLFQTVVTPHHNDAHANHVHLEIDPAGGELWIH